MPHAAIPLSDAGRQQASHIAALLPANPAAVLMSDMVRTWQTAAPYCARVSATPEKQVVLNEFSLIDATRIAGMNGEQHRRFVRDYWDNPDPHRRWGTDADTFAEFVARVRAFITQHPDLPDTTVVFGHGIWLIMLHWLLAESSANTLADMQAFQRYRLDFAMPNCAAFALKPAHSGCWRIAPIPLLTLPPSVQTAQ